MLLRAFSFQPTCMGSESVLLSLCQYSWHSAGLLSHLRICAAGQGLQ